MNRPDVPPIRIPDEFTVWAASDVHGHLRAVDRLLNRAGLTDGDDRSTAPPDLALVVTGDVVDRGPDSPPLVRLEPGLHLSGTAFLAAPAEPRAIADTPVTAEDVLQFDATLPAIVDAWIASLPASAAPR
ncbi:MAG TPA: metallophosphoesterase [Candidatus Limnocylindrales bacterium]